MDPPDMHRYANQHIQQIRNQMPNEMKPRNAATYTRPNVMPNTPTYQIPWINSVPHISRYATAASASRRAQLPIFTGQRTAYTKATLPLPASVHPYNPLRPGSPSLLTTTFTYFFSF